MKFLEKQEVLGKVPSFSENTKFIKMTYFWEIAYRFLEYYNKLLGDNDSKKLYL